MIRGVKKIGLQRECSSPGKEISKLEFIHTMKYYAFTKENVLDNLFNQIDSKKIQKIFLNLEESFFKSVRYVLVGASLVAKMIKNPPAMQETLVLLLGHKDPLEKG